MSECDRHSVISTKPTRPVLMAVLQRGRQVCSLGSLLPAIPSLLARWSALEQELQAALRRVFYPDAVEEWLEENVHPSLQRLQGLLQDLSEAAGPPPLLASPCPDTGQDP